MDGIRDSGLNRSSRQGSRATMPAGTEKDAVRRPVVEVLGADLLERVVAGALDVLREVGVFVESDPALALLAAAGAAVDRAGRRARIPEELVRQCLATVPSSVTVFDRLGRPAMKLKGLEVHFDPGSAALRILDSEMHVARAPVTADLIRFARVTDALDNIRAQSTAIIPVDVPEALADRWRLYAALMHSRKPIVTGTFTPDGFECMRRLLESARGGARELREKPLAIFDVCSSQPLRWSRLTVGCLMDCARAGIPAELISVPLPGATAPGTLAGALVQHTAENLSGVVIHQLAGPGCPLIYGGSPAVFDQRHGTVALGAAETMLMCAAYAQIGRRLGMPTHAYLGLSDAKAVDAQAGLESGMGAMTAALAGINVVSGAGMLEFENCQSLEKLVIDNETCGMALRFVRGLVPREELLAADLWGNLDAGDCFLTSPTTVRWLREEFYLPGDIVDRLPAESSTSGRGILARAKIRVDEILAQPDSQPPPEELAREMERIIRYDAQAHGVKELPSLSK